MTTAAAPAKRAPAKAVPEFVAAITEMANNLAAERFRADQAEAKLAEQDDSAVLQDIIDGLRADITEINRILNWYGETRGWCSDYETLQRLTNERLTQSKLLCRPEFSRDGRDEALPRDPDWQALAW